MYTTSRSDTSLEREVLERIGRSWDTRVAVRKERLDLSQYCDPSIPEFPISLVPFWDDEDFSGIGDEEKRRFLALAWVAYNEKAIYLEDEIINPLAGLLLKDRLPGADSAQIKQVLAQTLVDEQFHILMCLDICNSARERHRIGDYRVPPPTIGLRLRKILYGAPNEREYALARLAYGSFAEMSINGFLNQVANDTTIQPLNRLNTDMHRRDESVHGIAFREITASVYKNLDAEAQRSFCVHMATALDDYTTPDNTAWASILEYMKIPGRERIMARLEAATKGKRLSRDYAIVENLFEELGITEAVGFTSA